MYLQFYDLNKAPFQRSLNPDFFWQGRKIQTLLQTLKFDFERHTRINLITGEPGCGKTSVIRAALDSLHPSVLVAMVPDSRLSVREFYDLTGHALGLPRPLPNRKTFLHHILALLHKAAAQEQHVLLVLDEAQQLSSQLIEEIEAIITLGTDELEGLSVCLVGQLDDAVCSRRHLLSFFEKHDMVLHHLAAMTLQETSDYIQHRLQVGGATRKIFTDDAVQAIHKHANGYPVQINSICDLALFIGKSKQAMEIDAALILANIDKLQFPTRQNLAPTRSMDPATAGRDKKPHDNPTSIKAVNKEKPAAKQRISALEVFAQKDRVHEKQQSETKHGFILPALGLFLILTLGISGYAYHSKWASSQTKSSQGLTQQPKTPVSQIAAASFPSLQGANTISSSNSTLRQVDKTLHRSQKETHYPKVDSPKDILLQEDHAPPLPALPQEQPDKEIMEENKLVMPEIQEQIQDILQQATRQSLLDQPIKAALEQKKQEKAAFLPSVKNFSHNKERGVLPEPPARSEELTHFLAGGSFNSIPKRTNGQKADSHKKLPITSSTSSKQKEKQESEPAPAEVIDWLLNKKNKKINGS